MSAPRLIRATPRRPRLSPAPYAVVVIEFEGQVDAYIRGAGTEEKAASFRAWLESDPELAEFCRLTRRLRERMGTT